MPARLKLAACLAALEPKKFRNSTPGVKRIEKREVVRSKSKLFKRS